jgi:hypothetical protein
LKLRLETLRDRLRAHRIKLIENCDYMVQADSELCSAWSFPIIEHGKEYHSTAKLYKSKLVIEDKKGNKIAVEKRSKAMLIERWGKVEWLGSSQIHSGFLI